MSAARIRRLTLTNFRSYRAAQIEVAASPVVLVGPNGAGKTNLIEAISFLAPGRGLRLATLYEVAFQEGNGSWAVSADVDGALGLATLGTGIEAPMAEDAPVSRKCRIDREPATSVAALSDHLRVIWLVPRMDRGAHPRAPGAGGRGPLSRRAQGQPRARRRRRPHPRRPPSYGSGRPPCPQGHPGRRRLDRRAEGPAHRSHPGACEPAHRDVRLCSGPAARRSDRPP